MKPQPKVLNKAQRNLSSYEGRWLPHPSLGTFVGMALFFMFIGSAIRSVLPSNKGSLMGDTSSAAASLRAEEEATVCSRTAAALPHSSCSNSSSSSSPRKVLYMQPYGGLGSRLRAVASALTLQKEHTDVDVVIVWQNAEHGFVGAWDQLFSGPELPLGCFPPRNVKKHGALFPDSAACTVHTVNTRKDWYNLQNNWETMTAGGEDIRALCEKSLMYLTEQQRELAWFYKLLKPAKIIQTQVDAFMDAQNWKDPATTWVGVHARRTDLKLRCTSENCKEGVDVNLALPLSNFTTVMKELADLAPSDTKIRFYLATDDPLAEDEMKAQLGQQQLPAAQGVLRKLNAVKVSFGESRSSSVAETVDATRAALGKSVHTSNFENETIKSENDDASLSLPRVVSFPKSTRDANGGSWLGMRSVVSGLQEAVADLYLLSRCRVLVGTVGSTFSQTAKLMNGDNAFFITVGAELELKN